MGFHIKGKKKKRVTQEVIFAIVAIPSLGLAHFSSSPSRALPCSPLLTTIFSIGHTIARVTIFFQQ